MAIRDILIRALRRIGREELALEVENGGNPAGEGAEVVSTVLYCINAVEDELARYYFPLKCTETLYAKEKNTFLFSKFSHLPVKIISVKAGGEDVEFELQPNCLIAGAREIEVAYNYVPYRKSIDEDSEFGDRFDTKIIELGAAAEYCIICGEAALAEVWETRYREAIDKSRQLYASGVTLPDEKLERGGYIPPRRWI